MLGLAALVHIYGTLGFDITVSRTLQSLRSPGLDKVMEEITNLGNFALLSAVAGLCALYLFWQGKKLSAGLALFSLLSYPINVYIKDIVDRARPTSALIKIISPAGGFSFPSGHAMLTMSIYGTVAYLLWVNSYRRDRAWIIIVTGLLILVVGISRIYLGVHWFTDVLGGWIGGTILLLIVVEIQKKWLEKNPTTMQTETNIEKISA